ncbi:hypothetical protein BGX28_007294 [Mortierella sp. GBA30]|nr:hypothetical protein BGX28_007294 [Mortierella sp. GBA30]
MKDQGWGFEFDVEAMAQARPRHSYKGNEQKEPATKEIAVDSWFTDSDETEHGNFGAHNGWDEGEVPSNWSSQHQWYSTPDETIDPGIIDKEHHQGIQGRADDVWEVKKSLQWTAELDSVPNNEDEVVLDELTRYWASPNVIDVIRPKRPQEAFAEKPSVRNDSDSWGTPQPVMAYNGEGYISDVLIEQSNRKFWTMRNGEWVLLNESIDTTITHQQQGRVASWTSTDEDDKHEANYGSWDDSDSDYENSYDYPGDQHTAGAGPTIQLDFSPQPFDYDYAGFVGEDEWRKPISARNSVSTQASPKDDSLWTSDNVRSESSSKVSPMLEPTMPEVLPDFSTAKPYDNGTLSDRCTDSRHAESVPSISTTQNTLEDTLVDLLADQENQIGDFTQENSIILDESLLGLSFQDEEKTSVNGPAVSIESPPGSEEGRSPSNTDAVDLLIDTGSESDSTTETRSKSTPSPTSSLLIDVFDGLQFKPLSPESSSAPPTASNISKTLISIDSTLPSTCTTAMSAVTIAECSDIPAQSSAELISVSPEPSISPTPLKTATGSSSSSDILSDLASPHEWLNQVARRNVQQFEESRTENRQQWIALMAKQEEDSKRFREFVQKDADRTDETASAATNTKSARVKDLISLAVVVETKEFGKQELLVTNQEDLKDAVEKFCAEYKMHSYEMALWVTVASAIKQKKKRLRAERKLTEGTLTSP